MVQFDWGEEEFVPAVHAKNEGDVDSGEAQPEGEILGQFFLHIKVFVRFFIGAVIYDVHKLDPLPLVQYRIHATSFHLSAFWGPLSLAPVPPPTTDVIDGSPLVK